MELLVCGTSAAEAWPALFCTCAPCQEARRRGGKDVRSRAAYMIGDRVRVDFGPDSTYHMLRFGLAYERLDHLLVTHAHEDHWTPHEISYRRKGFSVAPDTPLRIWGNQKVHDSFVAENGDDWGKYCVEFHGLTAWQPVDLGEGLRATPVPASHDPSQECMTFVVEQGGRSLLIGHDTGWYRDESWEFLAGKPLDVALLDCTYGSQESSQGHLGCSWVVRARDELAKRGSLAGDARVFATHFSHNGAWLHDDLERYFAPHGIGVCYDGLRIGV